MTIIEIKSPEFRILANKNVVKLEQEVMKLCKDDWYPVGAVGRKGTEWIQVIVKERR